MSKVLFLNDEKLQIPSLSNVEIIVDFSSMPKEEKFKLYDSIPGNIKIMGDLTCEDPKNFYVKYPHFKASFSSQFVTSSKKIECHLNGMSESEATEVFAEMGLTPLFISQVDIGFIYPRVISMIINEAGFAIDEEVATENDINRAMKFGVNYPAGPFEWLKDKRPQVIRILKNLNQKYPGGRYELSRYLQR